MSLLNWLRNCTARRYRLCAERVTMTGNVSQSSLGSFLAANKSKSLISKLTFSPVRSIFNSIPCQLCKTLELEIQTKGRLGLRHFQRRSQWKASTTVRISKHDKQSCYEILEVLALPSVTKEEPTLAAVRLEQRAFAAPNVWHSNIPSRDRRGGRSRRGPHDSRGTCCINGWHGSCSWDTRLRICDDRVEHCQPQLGR